MFFFGYGSLVNAATHAHAPCLPATVRGWRRTWVATPQRALCYLSVVRDPAGQVEGAIAPVPDGDWAALDLREAAYARHDATADVTHDSEAGQIAIYSVPPEHSGAPGPENAILLSYLDTVIGGFLHLHGRAGAEAFFATTSGWEAAVLNDRAAPRYPRSIAPTHEVLDLIDESLSSLGSRIVMAE